MKIVFNTDDSAFWEVALHKHTLIALHEAAGTGINPAPQIGLGRYIDYVIQERASIWRRALSDLEIAGWGARDISDACAQLAGEYFLHHFEHADVVIALGHSGLKKHARRIRRRSKLARALLTVALELRADNATCRSEIARARPLRKPVVIDRVRRWLRGFAA